MYTHALNDFLWLVYCANMSLPEETNYNNTEHQALGINDAKKKFLKQYLFPNKLLSFTYGSSDIENRAFIEFTIRTMDANASTTRIFHSIHIKEQEHYRKLYVFKPRD